jgi:hypothetical protein
VCHCAERVITCDVSGPKVAVLLSERDTFGVLTKFPVQPVKGKVILVLN